MNRTDIKKAMCKLSADEAMEQRLWKKICENASQDKLYGTIEGLSENILKNTDESFAKDTDERILTQGLKGARIKPLATLAAFATSVAVVVCLGMLGQRFWDTKYNSSSDTAGFTNSNKSIESQGGIIIPQIKLPEKSNATADMIGLIVYQGRVYTQTGTRMSAEIAEKMRGEKLGTTKGNIDEWSSQKEYAVEFASTVGKQNVYAVRGYDKSFRIMTYGYIEGKVFSELYECFNGITVKTGEDIFGRLKIEDNVKSAVYERFESWNYSKQQYNELKKLDVVNSFVKELKNTVPYTQESHSNLFTDTKDEDQKFVYLMLNDGTEVQLRLFKEGFVFYSNCHLFFKMDSDAFGKLWKELK